MVLVFHAHVHVHVCVLFYFYYDYDKLHVRDAYVDCSIFMHFMFIDLIFYLVERKD